MRKRLVTLLPIVVAVLMILSMVTPALANPPFPEGDKSPVTVRPPEDVTPRPAVRRAKPIDQPNIKDYLRNRQRQKLLEAGQTAEARALDLTGTDRVLVILVEFAGTDVFTWEAGVSTWDPYGRADPNEYTGTVGDCSLIITQTTVFTYTGPLHNDIPRPVSPDDRSADSIWTEDFSPQWFDGFMFGEGVVFDFTMQDGTPVFEDFTGQSVRDYYEDLSDGRYTITGDVIGWLQLPHSTWWYGADECPGARSGGGRWHGAIPGAGNARTLVTDALDAVNAISDTIPGFDWANYDLLDGDGVIDRLWIVHSGYGEEDSTTLLNRTDYSEASLWSHSSAISPPYEVAPGISAGPYIMMPENGGIGVFAHEYGHNLGADDLYAYDQGETSAGFWTLMADDWTGYPIGFEPPAVDPWHLDNWGWLEPFVITNPNQVYEVTLGQASRFPGEEGMYRGVKIVLPEGVFDLPVPIWQGDYYWWGGKENLANAMMTTKNPIAIPAGGATLSFDLVYDIEDEWDFLWIQVSTVPSPEPSGVDWDTLTNENTQCEHDPAWIGGEYGFPVDLCGAGIGGFYGYNENWPDPEVQEFDLSAYAGQSIYLRFWYMTDWASLYSGAFVDNVKVTANTTVLFEDNAEAGDAKWVYQDPWQRSDGTQAFTHNFYLQWRNVSEDGGYDSALGEERWRFGPANSDLLVWYNNNFYTDNEIWHYFLDDPSVGPKGRMLVVDSQYEPYRDPDLVAMGYNNTGANLTSRGQMRDAPFTWEDTVSFTHTDPYRAGAQEHSYPGRPAKREFHDSMGYYPGAEYVNRGPYYPPTQFKWVTKQWDASAVVPSTASYPLKAPGYTADEEFRFNCTPYLSGPYTGALACYWFGAGVGLGYDGGTGNPGDYDAQYGWHVELIEQAADDTWGTVRIWNSLKELDVSFEVDTTEAETGDELTYTCDIEKNIGSKVNALAVIPLDTKKVEYVPRSAFGGAVPVPSGLSPEELAKVYAYGGWGALRELASSATGKVGSIVWIKSLGTGQGADPFGFSVEVTVGGGDIDMAAYFFDDEEVFQVEEADTVSVTARIFLPLIFKNYTPPVFEFTILHTNDTHARLESFLVGNVLQGGVARRYTAIQQVKAEGGNVVLVDAGDAFQGTLFFNVWEGEEEAYFMNALGYQAMAVGNHEFDLGPAALANFIGWADFPVLSANIDASAEPTLAGLIPAYTVLDVAGEQIGVFGLTTEETPIISSPGPNVVFNDVVASAQATVAELEGLGINKIVALTHIGYSADQTLAAAVDGIDVIVGGHSHTLLGSMAGAEGPYPTVVTSPAGDTVLIVSAQDWGKYLGRLDVAFTADGKVQSYTGEPIFIDQSFAEDPTIAADVATFAEPIEELKNTVIGQTAVHLEGTRALVRSQETNLGNLICDAMLWETATENTQICVQNGGGIRASIPAGDVTMGQVLEVLPFGNQIATFGLKGSDVWAALENGVSQYEIGAGRFAQVGGLRYFFDPSQEVGSRIVSVEVENAEGGYDPIDPDAVYKLTSNDFMRRGGDGYDMFANNAIDPYDFGAVQADALANYIGVHSPVSPAVEGRIVKLDKLITILHTNDIHGRFPTDEYRGTPQGMTYLASYIAAERAKNPNVLLLDAGDTFQGNAFAQYFRNATPNPIAGAMNMLDYDAFVIGNHEFNFGPTTFATMLGQLDFPILGSANLDDDGTYGFINDSVEDYITLEVEGVKVAIFGLTNPEVPIYELPSNIAGLTFYPATTTAQALVPQIQTTEAPDLMIALTHIGYDVYKGSYDKDKAIAEQVPGIDVLIGGHSHDRLDPAVTITSTINPTGTLVAQTAAYAQYLGKINVGFVSDGTGGYDVVFREGYLIEAKYVDPDADLVAYLDPFVAELEAYTSTEIGQTTAPIDALTAYTEETTGANVQTDAAVWALTQNAIPVDFHLSGAMSNRKVADAATPENPVTLTVGDMYTLMPYENSLVVMEMNGPRIKTILERAYRNYYYYKYVPDRGGYSYYTTCMLDINAGGVITYNDTYPELPDGNNVVSLVFNGQEVDFADADTYYNVSSVNYLVAGSCNFNDAGVTLWPLDQITYDTQYYVRDSVIDYITAMGTISPQIEGRLVFLTD